MPNINDTFPSKYLKASDLDGHEPIVTVDRVEFEPVGQDKEMKGVLYFTGKAKGLVLNKTNARKLIEITGSALTEEWAGAKVKLYETETQYGGDMVACIRIKPVTKPGMSRMTPAAPTKPKPAPPSDEAHGEPVYDDEVPFAWLVPFVAPLAGLLGAGLLVA